MGLSWLLQGDEEKYQMTWLSSFATTELEHQDAALTEFIDFLKNQAQEYLSLQKADIAQNIYGDLEVAISY